MQLRLLGGEVEPVKLSSIASPNNLQSATDTPPDSLDESELLPLFGIETEPVETLSIDSPPINQSTTDAPPDLFNLSEQLPLKEQSLDETIGTLSNTSPSDLQSASDFMDPSKELPLTLQQREAINRRHHLKFITGHYGSGKVTLSHTCNWYMHTRM